MSPCNAPSPVARPVLLLGGTAEARALAERLAADGVAATTALAGRTRHPGALPGAIRIGGFGGAQGLASHLRDHAISALIDASHPFAARISANAVAAADATGVPLLRLVRPAWPARRGWQLMPTLDAAAAALPRGARVLLTIGRQEIDAFAARSDCHFVARMIDPPGTTPGGWSLLLERGPFTLETESDLLRTHAITHLVSKNSGARAVAAKLEAAEALGVKVVMVERPTLPVANEVESVDEARAWVGAQAGVPQR